jgi:hypothetical protein
VNFFQGLSLFIAMLALFISGLNAYKTFYARFTCDFFIKPRVILAQVDNSPALVIACEIMSSGASSGSIDDVVLAVKTKQATTRSIDRYTFFPKLMRDTYSVFKNYAQEDFEPFQTIPLTAKSRLSTHIIFVSANGNFVPSVGEMTIQLFFKVSGTKKWQGSQNMEVLEIDQQSQSLWTDASNPRSVMIETKGNYEDRDKLMEEVFK